jgi:hypothetical protein
MSLDLGRTFENRQNAGIAKDTTDRVLERKTVPAVDL